MSYFLKLIDFSTKKKMTSDIMREQFNEAHDNLNRTMSKYIGSPVNKRPKQKPVVLYLDDEVKNLEGFKASFRRDYSIITCLTVEEAFDALENNHIDVVLSDHRMPGKIKGVDFLCQVKKDYPKTLRILVTGYSDIKVVEKAINIAKIWSVIPKPWNHENLLNSIKEGLFNNVFTPSLVHLDRA